MTTTVRCTMIPPPKPKPARVPLGRRLRERFLDFLDRREARIARRQAIRDLVGIVRLQRWRAWPHCERVWPDQSFLEPARHVDTSGEVRVWTEAWTLYGALWKRLCWRVSDNFVVAVWWRGLRRPPWIRTVATDTVEFRGIVRVLRTEAAK